MASLELVVKAVDQASGPLGQIQGRADSLGSKLKTGLKVGAVAAATGIGALAIASVKFVGDAADLEEAINKANVVFGQSADRISSFADTSARSFGIARVDALSYSATLGVILKGSGLTQEASADMSLQLVKLAADMASFNNIPIDVALEKIRAGLVGESEPLRTVGVLLSEAAVQQEAYASGIAAAGAKLTDQQKVQARFNIIQKQTADTQGDFARTSQSLTNQQRILGAEWKNLRATIGGILLPIITRLAQALTRFLSENEPQIRAFIESFNAWVQSDAFPFLERAFAQLHQLIRGIMDTGIIQWLAEHKEVALALAIVLGLLLIAFGGPIATIIGLIAVGTILLANWDAIRDKAEELAAKVTAKINEIIETVKNIPILGEIFQATFEAIRVIVETYFALMKIQVETAIKAIQAIIEIVLGIIHGDFDRVWRGIKDLVGALLNGLKDSVGVILGALGQLIFIILMGYIGVYRDLFTLAVNAAIDALKALPGLVGGVLGDAYRQILSWIDIFQSAGERLVAAIIRGIKNKIGEIDNLVKSIIDKINPLNWDIPGLSPFEEAFRHAGQKAVAELNRGLRDLPQISMPLEVRGSRIAALSGGFQVAAPSGSTYHIALTYAPTYGDATPAEAERLADMVEHAIRRRGPYRA